jgi:hypothetical protein
MKESARPDDHAVIQYLSERLSDEERGALIGWARDLLAIRSGTEAPMRKARRALGATYRRKVVTTLLSTTAGSLKDLAWDDRSWSARLGIGAAAITAATFGMQGAGIAALGSAIGVPLWIVLGAGGSFAGMLVDELSRGRTPRVGEGGPGDHADVVDAEWTFAEPPALPTGTQGPEAHDAEGRDPLWGVFKRAYRDARERQKNADDPL